MASKKLKTIILSMAFVVPTAFGLSRDIILNFLAGSLSIELLPLTDPSALSCSGNVCRLVYQIDRKHKDENVAVGFHSAFAESRVVSSKPSQTWKKKDLELNWFEFIVARFPDTKKSNSSIWIECFASSKSKKIGIDSSHVFIGSEKNIRILEFAFKLFNVHLYLILAIASLGFGALLSIADTLEKRVQDWRGIAESFLVASALIGYSHVFDSAFGAVGIPTYSIQAFPRVLWGTTILYFVYKKSNDKIRNFLVFLYLIFVLPAMIPTGFEATFLHGMYRWVVTSVVVLIILRIVTQQQSRTLAPFAILALLDAAILHDLLSLRAGLYLSPLGLLGLFAAANEQSISNIMMRNGIFLRSAHLRSRIDCARKRYLNNMSDWEGFLKESLLGLQEVTTSSRISIFFQRNASPIILALCGKTIRSISDGQIPPLYARVLQTREEYWWISSSEIEVLLGSRSAIRPDQYRCDFAIIVPITVNDEVYGIISLTDFVDDELGNHTSESRHLIDAMVRHFLALISAELISRQERSSQNIQAISNQIMETFISSVENGFDRRTIIETFFQAVFEFHKTKAMYFDFDKETRRLHLLSTNNLDESTKNLWSQIPFRARLENHISPFAVSINENRTVYIDDIRNFYSLLEEQSKITLKLTDTKGFLTVPVQFNSIVVGLLVFMDNNAQTPVRRELAKILTVPVQYLGFKLAECDRTILLNRQSRILSNFVEADLAHRLVEAETNSLPIGRVEQGVLIVQDLRGSTSVSKEMSEAEAYAKSLYRFYCGADLIGDETACRLEITVGDSLVYIAKDHNKQLSFTISSMIKLLNSIENLAKSTMGVRGIISIFHYGQVFKGIFSPERKLRWDITGADFNDLFKMESAAKAIDGAVVAMSQDFINVMDLHLKCAIEQIPHEILTVKAAGKQIHVLNSEQFERLITQIKLVGEQSIEKNVWHTARTNSSSVLSTTKKIG